MSEEDLLKKAQSVFRLGDRQAAATLFAQQVQENPNSEEAWLGLGLALQETKKRIFCLQRVLTLNPENQAARQALDWLQSPPPESPGKTPAFVVTEVNTPTGESSHALIPPVPLPAEEIPDAETHLPQPASTASQKKKRNAGLIWFFIILILFVISLTGLFFAYSTGMLDFMLPPSLRLPAVYPPSNLQLTLTSAVFTAPTNTLRITPSPTVKQVLDYTPVFEEVDCPFEPPGKGEIICGNVSVPEDRTDAGTDNILLTVAVYTATGLSPAAEPVIFLQGGPGAGAVELSAEAYSILVEPFLENHTFITFDQRGTGLSQPKLNCVELTQVYSQILRGLIPVDTRSLVLLNAFRACHDLLNIEGIDLSAYTTEDNAADVIDILRALGYSRADLYGASYGTRLGQVVMKNYPEYVRVAILDSMLPLEVNIYASSSHTAEDAFRTLFDSCLADPACDSAYPDLEGDFWALVDSMHTTPLVVPVAVPYAGGRSSVMVDGGMYLNQVLASMKQTWMIPGIPLSIEQVSSGDTSSLSYTLGFPPIDWDLEISLGMYISIMCHEYIMDSDAITLTDGLSGHFSSGELGWFPFIGDGENFIKLCEGWDSVPPSPGEDTPLSSDIPTLVIAGKFDSITPPTFGQLVASHLTNSFYLEFPDKGHTPTAAVDTDCPMKTVLSFLEHPETGPDSACMEMDEAPHFLVPFTATEAVPMVTRELEEYSITVNIPEEWIDLGDGIYIRGSSGLDITQLIILRLEATPPEALAVLSERTFYGRMMLDSEPVAADERNIGAFRWAFYTTTSFGTPVDMVLANDQGTTLMVLLFTHTKERDALNQAVFLPVIESILSTK